MNNINYHVPQLEDKLFVADGLNLLYFIDRSYLMEKKYFKQREINKKNNFTEENTFQNIINDSRKVIKKFDNNNYLTINSFPYANPLLCNHLIFWTLNDKTHNDVLRYLSELNIINSNVEYLIWQNNLKHKSIKTIKHYQILFRPKIFKSIKRKLRKIIIVARHGPREPIHLLPKLEEFKLSDFTGLVQSDTVLNKVLDAKLTLEGLKFCYNYGTYIKSLFENYFQFDLSKSTVLSTNVDRTINSAIQFINGLFDLTNNNLTNNTIFDKSKITLSGELLGDINMSPELRESYNNFHDQIKLLNVDENLNNEIYRILGYKIKHVKDYFNIYSTIKVYKFHKIKLPEEWTDELDKQLDNCAAEYYYRLFYKTQFCKLFTDSLLNRVNLLISDPNINFAYLSTHDVVIYPFAIRLAKEEVHLPDFSASIRFEIWDEEMRIYYDNILICNELL